MPAQAPATTADLLALLARSGVLPADPPDFSDLPPDPVHAATALVNRGVLSKFQARMLLAGKSKGFRLGQYVIREQLGQGGMGAVYLGVHVGDGHKAALKVLPAVGNDRQAVSRFQREARIAASLDHPNIVKVLEVAREGDVWFLAMEYVPGKTLAEVKRASGGVGAARAVDYIAQAAAGLQHADEKGFVHRDIKPANLMLTPDGVVKLLDFGLAGGVGAGDGAAGTAGYAAPEQTRHDPNTDIRADIYSLGLTFYALVTGRPPFEGTTASKLVQQQLDELPRLDAHDKTFPPKLARVVAKMTAKDPADRYQTAGEVIEALSPWLADSPVSVEEEEEEEEEEDEPRAKGVPAWVWLAAGGVVLAAVAGGVVAAVLVLAK